jgi:hypothetical protein
MRNLLFEILALTQQSRTQEEEMCYLRLEYADTLETFVFFWKLETDSSGRFEYFRISGMFFE